MAFVNGGMINVSKGAAGNGSTLPDITAAPGLACFTASFSGVTTTSISHQLGTTELVVEFRDGGGNLLIPDNWSILNTNSIEVEFATSQTGEATIIGCVPSGLPPLLGGVVLLEGLSGIIDLDSPNGSIDISTSGQVINLNALFTPASGAIIDQIITDITILSGLLDSIGPGCFSTSFSGITTTTVNHGLNTTDVLVEFKDTTGSLLLPDNWSIVDVNNIKVEFATPQAGDVLIMGCLAGGTTSSSGVTSIQGLSGVIQLNSPNDTIDISVSGQTINLDVDIGISLNFSQASGVEFVMEHGLSTERFVWDMWKSDENPIQSIIPTNIAPSGNNHVIVTLDTPMSGFVNLIGIN